MGGRIHGFLGGVLLTTAAAYYSSKQFRENQQFVSRTLKETEDIINGINKPAQPVPRVLEFTHRPFRETIADLWNESVLSGVRAVYAVDFESVGAGVVEWVTKKF